MHLAPDERVLSTLNVDGSRNKIRPRLSEGRFLRARRVVAYGLIVLFAALPYISINGKPAILLDLVAREFTFFGVTFLPTDTLLLMLFGLAIVLAVFLLTALFGRVWCGWACPQTVYLEFLYRPIERLFEGNPSQQRRLDEATGLSPRRVAKNVVFFVISAFVAHTFLAYFVGVSQLVQWVQQSPVDHPVAFILMAFVTAIMFADFAWFREQTCIVACPYGRLQAVLLDPQSLIVGYDATRGEPRAKPKKGDKLPTVGDCIDCNACVATCPTGIDIRSGLQMECIGCTQCIDACDAIMDKVKRPRGLIRYTSQDELAGKGKKLFRARIVVYPALLAVVFGAFVFSLGNRAAADITVLRLSGSPFSILADGRVSTSVRLKVANRTATDKAYHLELLDPSGGTLVAPQNPAPVPTGTKREVTMFILSPAGAFVHGERTIQLRITDGAGFDEVVDHVLIGPESPSP